MPTEQKTDQRLIDRLERAARHSMTADEIRQQRVSFVYGNLPHDSTMTKSQVERALARLEGEPA